jgi:hypothetical protein
MLPHIPFGKPIRLEMLIAIPGLHSIAQVARNVLPRPTSGAAMGPSCGQYEDMPSPFKCPLDGSGGLTDLPIGLAVTVTPSVR